MIFFFQLPHVTHIIFFEDPLKHATETTMSLKDKVNVIPFREIVTKVRKGYMFEI